MSQPEPPRPDGTATPLSGSNASDDLDRLEEEIIRTPLSPDEKRGSPLQWRFLAFALLGAAVLMLLLI